MADLSALMRINKSSVTWMIDRAEEAGLVCRRTDGNDRRSLIVELAQRGSVLGATYRARVTELVDDLIVDLNPTQRESLRRVLSQVVQASQEQST
jgi:DNA-binding MarR family transcriptional regulator